MPFRHAARHISVRSRMAHRRIRQVLERATAPKMLGPATLWFGSVSLLSHAVVTWGVIAIAPAPLPDASSDPLVASRFLYPLMQQQPRPSQEHVSYVGMLGRSKQTAPAMAKGGVTPGPSPEIELAVAPAPPPPPPAESESSEAFSELEVDVTAERDPESEGPTYPDSLLEKKIEGEARVRFVIDSTGHADASSFAVLETNQSAFAEAVRMALPRMKFKPASIGKKPVAQSVEQTFLFRITRPPLVP